MGLSRRDRDRRLFWTTLQEAQSLDWHAVAEEQEATDQAAATGDIWGEVAKAGSGSMPSSVPVPLQQLRFTAVVGSDPSRSDLGLDNLYVQDCSPHVARAVRIAKHALSSSI